MPTSYWKTADGRTLDISEMSTGHLRAAIVMLERKGFVSLKEKQFYLTCKGPDGEAAQDHFNSDFDRVMNAPINPQLDNLRDELKKRTTKELKEQSQNRAHRSGVFVAEPVKLTLDELIAAIPADRED